MRCRRSGFALNGVTRDVPESSTVAAQSGSGGRLTVSVLVFGALLAACSGSTVAAPAQSPSSVAPPTVERVSPTTPTTLDLSQKVIAAYEDYVHQYTRVSDDPNGNPMDELLAATMTTRLAQQVQRSISDLRSAHRYTKGALIVHPQRVTIQGSSATLVTCNRDDSDQYDQNGVDVSAHPGVGVPQVLNAVLVLSPSGRWLVDQNVFTGGPCTI